MSFRELLERYRAQSKSERGKGTYFERLVKVWLENAPLQKSQFSRVLTFGEWAAENRFDQRDTGIDLVAQLADSPEDWCAIQCKFYREGYRIQKGDIDSFFTASGKRPFTRRMIVDTTGVQWGEHAEEALHDQIVETIRVGLSDLEDSGIDWAAFVDDETVKLVDRKTPRPHQVEALEAVRAGLAEADRGKVIMACGTGKTYAGLMFVEALAGKGGRVLFLVPSLSLMSQTIREWSIDSGMPLRSFAVCSDSQVGVRKAADGDLADIDIHDLEIPATTNALAIASKATADAPEHLTVVFSTYQSIKAVAEAQASFGLPDFDLIICDEAHRTTGVTLEGEEESNFVRVRDAAAGIDQPVAQVRPQEARFVIRPFLVRRYPVARPAPCRLSAAHELVSRQQPRPFPDRRVTGQVLSREGLRVRRDPRFHPRIGPDLFHTLHEIVEVGSQWHIMHPGLKHPPIPFPPGIVLQEQQPARMQEVFQPAGVACTLDVDQVAIVAHLLVHRHETAKIGLVRRIVELFGVDGLEQVRPRPADFNQLAPRFVEQSPGPVDLVVARRAASGLRDSFRLGIEVVHVGVDPVHEREIRRRDIARRRRRTVGKAHRKLGIAKPRQRAVAGLHVEDAAVAHP
ncbi:MAG: DEAD/DEAH box helicase family protein [Rhodobiaceae bacterium]|nr:DEAD/DEAH box helicase family protein [Rhodobiaceae bacterium]